MPIYNKLLNTDFIWKGTYTKFIGTDMREMHSGNKFLDAAIEEWSTKHTAIFV